MITPTPAVPPAHEPRPYDPERHRRAVARLADTLAGSVPGDWRRIDLKVRMVVGACAVDLRTLLKTGSAPLTKPFDDIVEICAELRSLMYRPEEGTWFGMRFMMDPPDTVWVSYNRKYDPLWDPPLSAEEWSNDLTVFPRSDEHLPGWLRRLHDHLTPEGF